MPAQRKYPPELRESAVRLVHEAREEDPELSMHQSVQRIGSRVGVNADTCAARESRPTSMPGYARDHQRRRAEDQAAGGAGAGTETRQRNTLGGFEFLRAGARPAIALVITFIDDHKDRLGGRADLPGAQRARLPDRRARRV